MKLSPGSLPRRLLLLCSLSSVPIAVLDTSLRGQWSRLCTALPLALVLALLLALPAYALAGLLRWLDARGLAWPALAALAMLGLGFALSNVLLIDQPLEPATCVGYGLSFAAALALGALVRGRAHDERALAVALTLCAALALVLDRFAFVVQYRSLHAALRIAASLGTTIAAWLWLGTTSARSAGLRALLPIAAALLLTLPCLPASVIHRSLFAQQTPEGWIVERLLQGDAVRWLGPRIGAHRCAFGAGQAALLDARAPCPTPLALSWRIPGPATPTGSSTSPRPRAVVLVTVDAFRCGLGQREREPFRDACPRLAALARRPGGTLGSIQVSYPATRPALLDLHCFGVASARECLAGRLASLGYTGTAIATHRQLQQPLLMLGFEHWDESLLAQVAQPRFVSSPVTADRTLAAIREGAGTSRFVWTHFYDPHDPYLPASGSHFSLSGETSYVDELERTDRALGTLLESIEALGEPAVVVVTGDHGEAFGEHHTSHHGYELYESGVRVPFVALAFHGVRLPDEQPRQSTDLAPYLLSLVGEQAFRIAPPRPMRTENLWGISDGTTKLILDRFNGRIELYDLVADPEERDDVAEARPERASELLAGLAAAL